MYPTTAELVALGDDPALSGASQATQDRYRALAIRGLEGFTRQSFTEYEGPVEATGMGSRDLYLPRRLIALTSVTGAGDISPGDLTISVARDRLTVKQVGGNYYERALRDLDHFRPIWPRGDGNIVLEGRWGWEDLPDGIAEILATDMVEQARSSDAPLAGSIEQFRALGIRSISQGNLALSLAVRPSGLSASAASMVDPSLIWTGTTGLGAVV